MQKAAEGLTGDAGVNWLLLPGQAIVSGSGSGGGCGGAAGRSSMGTIMFPCQGGFYV